MIPIGSRQIFLVLEIWRIRCDECGSLRWPRLPFVRGKRKYTRGFARFAIDLLHWMTISGVAKVLSVGWDSVKDLHKEYLQRKYKVPPLKNLKYLGIDEFSIRKGHSYMSIPACRQVGLWIWKPAGSCMLLREKVARTLKLF